MPKPDFPSLLTPGIHRGSERYIYDIAVGPFPSDATRATLFQMFTQWAQRLRDLGLTGTLWLDGSFLTEKVGPGDVDVVLWNPQATRPLNARDAAEVNALLDHNAAKATFKLDLYVELPEPAKLVHRQAYWKGFFGYCHDTVTAKGFAEVPL